MYTANVLTYIFLNVCIVMPSDGSLNRTMYVVALMTNTELCLAAIRRTYSIQYNTTG
jgi:hypothetical protein